MGLSSTTPYTTRLLKGGAVLEDARLVVARGFAYVAWREHEQGASSRALTNGRVWRRWLLDAAAVEALFNQSARLGVLQVSRAGSAVRGDWRVAGLAEATGAAA
ncbi:MAG: hypothetical protein OXL98_12695 [Acidimicrobiaceae bacterium]|nr:hypothetical protein [Acidimicrobiaceae bacterium]